jgi:hypothetical protein
MIMIILDASQKGLGEEDEGLDERQRPFFRRDYFRLEETRSLSSP